MKKRGYPICFPIQARYVFPMLLMMIGCCHSFGQEQTISITIDDVPNTTKYQNDDFTPVLLNLLDSLEVPFTVFINEEKLFKTGAVDRNKALLESWIKNDRAQIGNHTYSHLRYSDVGLNRFIRDIEEGERLTRKYGAGYGKELAYFRFPFNDIGKDSTQHADIRAYLGSRNYRIAPFTVESSDWMFDAVYRYYLDQGEPGKARAIGEQYVEKTLALVGFFDEMARSLYNRPIKHIYLCHDNAINADFLAVIIQKLQQDGYKIESFEESLTDPIYNQEDRYYKKWGISWLYRWMDSQEERVEWMKLEPDLSRIQGMYEQLFEN